MMAQESCGSQRTHKSYEMLVTSMEQRGPGRWMRKAMKQEKQLSLVPIMAIQDRKAWLQKWSWVEPAAWTERMLEALERGVKGDKWFSKTQKPPSYGRGQSLKALPIDCPQVLLLHELFPQRREGSKSEQISEDSACVMALPISPNLGTEISVPNSGRNCKRGGVQLYSSICEQARMWSRRAEYPERSRPYDC